MDYSSTYRLAQDIRDSEEYKTYHELKEQVMAEETTAALVKEYRKLQMTIQMSAMSGKAADEEDMQRFSGISSLLFSKPEVSRFLLSRSVRDEREYGLYWYSGLWHILRPILVGLTVLILVVGIGMTVWNKLYGSFLAPVDPDDPTEYSFEISSGDSLNKVATNLEKAGLIRSKSLFKYYCDFAGMGQKIQVGSYTMTKGMQMTEIADLLTTGDGNPLVRNITLIPGETIEDFAARLVKNGVLENADKLLAICKDGKAFQDYYYVKDVLVTGQPEKRKYVLEGYLAPNTYEVYVHGRGDRQKAAEPDRDSLHGRKPGAGGRTGPEHGPGADPGQPDRKRSKGQRLYQGQRGVPQPPEGKHEAGKRRYGSLHYRRPEDVPV